MVTALPPVVQRLQAGFLASVRTNVMTTRYIPERYRQTLSTLLDKGAPVRVIADLTSTALIERFVDRLNRLEPGGLASCVLHGPARLFEPFPSQISGEKAYLFDRTSFLQETEGNPLPMGRVLEITYPSAYFSNETEWLDTSASIIHKTMSDYGLYFYHRSNDGMVTVRHTTLTLFEMGLRYCFVDRAARLCETDGRTSDDEINDLHRIGYHPHGLPLIKALPIHHVSEEEPALFGPHDNVHAIIWSSSVEPWQRTAATLLVDSIQEILNAEEREVVKKDRSRLFDLNVMGDALFRMQRSFRASLAPETTLRLLEDFLARIKRQYENEDLERPTGLLQFMRSLRTHIGQLRRQVQG